MAKREKTIKINTPIDNPREKGEDFTGRISLAVPNQTMSIQELIDKHSRGILDLPEADHFYLDDEEVPNWSLMPKIEQLEYAAELRRTVAQRKKKLEDLEAEGKEVKPEDVPKLTPTLSPPEDDEDGN
jgi:hypothetical protein